MYRLQPTSGAYLRQGYAHHITPFSLWSPFNCDDSSPIHEWLRVYSILLGFSAVGGLRQFHSPFGSSCLWVHLVCGRSPFGRPQVKTHCAWPLPFWFHPVNTPCALSFLFWSRTPVKTPCAFSALSGASLWHTVHLVHWMPELVLPASREQRSHTESEDIHILTMNAATCIRWTMDYFPNHRRGVPGLLASVPTTISRRFDPQVLSTS